MPKKCEIIIEEDTHYDAYWAIWFSSSTTFGEIDAKSVKDMIDKILKHIKTNKCCISYLKIMGHGGEGDISVGNGSRGTDSDKEISLRNFNESQLKRLKKHFCKGAVVLLQGCNVGAGNKGADLLHKLSKLWGVTVKAPLGESILHWDRGGYQEAKPGHGRPTPKPAPGGIIKKAKGRFQNRLVFMTDDGPHAIDIDQISSLAIVPRESLLTESNIVKSIIQKRELVSEILDGLNVYNPFPMIDWKIKIDAYLYCWLEGEFVHGLPLIKPSYLCGGYRYLIPAGDWTHAYQFIENISEQLSSLGPRMSK